MAAKVLGSAYMAVDRYAPVSAILSGALLHICYFRINEHHMHGLWYLRSGAAFTTVVWLMMLAIQGNATRAFTTVVGLAGWNLIGIYGSLLCYRLVWHPLRSFPGPVEARISGLWLTGKVIGKYDAHRKLLDLCNLYGPIVRVGPSDLMLAHPLAVPAVHAAPSKCRKGPWYDEDWPRQSIHTSRDHHFHNSRRRLWNLSFSDKAMRDYEKRLRTYNNALMECFSRYDGHPVDAAKWFHYYSYDVMGDLAFNKDFGMLRTGEEHFAVELLNEALAVQGLKLPTWLFRLLVAIPGLTTSYWTFIKYCDEQLRDKMTSGEAEQPSVMNVLLQHAGTTPSSQELLNLQSDARTLIVAGSDTTAATLAHIFYLLAQHPAHLDKLRAELQSLGDGNGGFRHQDIQKAEHLNGIINETMRLFPAVPTTVMRKTPPEGIEVADVWIPGNMNVFTPGFVIGRSELAYKKPNEFIPERWYSMADMVYQKVGFAPFSTGKSDMCSYSRRKLTDPSQEHTLVLVGLSP